MFMPLLRARAALGRRRPLASIGASIGTALDRCLGCRKGTSSVEFVLVLTPMMLFLFGIIGFGLVTYAHNNMVNAAREAARRLSVAEGVVEAANLPRVDCFSPAYDAIVTAALPKTAAEKIACDYLTNWGVTFEVAATECVPVTSREVTVTVTTDAAAAFLVYDFGLFTGDMTAAVTMRREAACT